MRHGDVKYFEADGRPVPPNEVSLTEDGRSQAQAAGEVLKTIPFDRVITSGLPRTVETARITLASVGIERQIEEWPNLREIQPGRLRDIPEGRLRNVFVGTESGLVDESVQFLNGETISSLMDRVGAAIDEIVADAAWDTILLVLHGGVNRAILSCALLGGRGYLGGIEQAPGCINILDTAGPNDWIIRAMNISPQNLAHHGERTTTMERLLAQYRPPRDS
jgi:probable phosphoglycerate mutase